MAVLVNYTTIGPLPTWLGREFNSSILRNTLDSYLKTYGTTGPYGMRHGSAVDATVLLTEAIYRAGTLDREKVLQTIKNTTWDNALPTMNGFYVWAPETSLNAYASRVYNLAQFQYPTIVQVAPPEIETPIHSKIVYELAQFVYPKPQW